MNALVLIALYAGSAFLIVGFIVTLEIFLIAYEDSRGGE